jgi:drug/metabolite transporter (DMT)-like permease
MSGLAFGIVLTAAFLHAGWNYLLKKSQKKIVFTWWFLLVALVLYFPMFVYFWPKTIICAQGWACIFSTGLLHFLYFWFMGGAYERGDLSLVYPLSRGSGPLFVPFFAVFFIHEQLSLPGMLGIALVVFGIYVIHLPSFSGQSFLEPFLAIRGGGSLWALCTGGTISAYSLVDKVGVGLVHPPVYIYLMFVITWLLLSPYVLAKKRMWLKKEWILNRYTILVVGVLVLGTYLIVLFAMQMTKVSYVVAVREVSIVFSAFYGIFWLKEKHGSQKLVGACFITLGVVSIGLSR